MLNHKRIFSYSFLTLSIFVLSIFLLSCSKKDKAFVASEDTHSSTGELVIYSPHSSDKTEFIIREFRQRTGIKTILVYEGTGELLEKLSTEEKEGISYADVFWGGGIESLESNKQLFTPYTSIENNNITSSYIDPEHYWTGFSIMTMVIVYNTTLVPQEKVPKTWTDLLDPFFTNRIIMPDPPRSGSAYSILNAMLKDDTQAENWEFIRKLKQQVGSNGLASSSSKVHTAIASGSYFAGLTSEDAALSIISKGSPISVVYPEAGTIAVPDGVALVKNAPHSENAKLFIDFVLSKDVQSLVSDRWFRRSVRQDVNLPVGAEPFDSIEVLPYDVFMAAQKRSRILQTWKEL